MSELEQRREEFFRYVWDHTTDLFVIGYEARPPLTDTEAEWLQQVYQHCRATWRMPPEASRNFLKATARI